MTDTTECLLMHCVLEPQWTLCFAPKLVKGARCNTNTKRTRLALCVLFSLSDDVSGSTQTSLSSPSSSPREMWITDAERVRPFVTRSSHGPRGSLSSVPFRVFCEVWTRDRTGVLAFTWKYDVNGSVVPRRKSYCSGIWMKRFLLDMARFSGSWICSVVRFYVESFKLFFSRVQTTRSCGCQRFKFGDVD